MATTHATPLPFAVEEDAGALIDRLLRIEREWLATEAPNPAHVDMRRLVDGFLSYARAFSAGGDDIDRKLTHTLRVAMACDGLATASDTIDRPTATLAGICHDVGRFAQWAMHRSYSDATSGCDHGRLGSELLGEFALMDRLVDMDGTDDGQAGAIGDVIEAVRWHNALSLPSDMGDAARALCDLLREGDVVDLLDLCGAGRLSPRDPAPTGEATPEVMGAIRSRHAVDRRLLATDTDQVLARVSLTFVLRSPQARRMANDHGGLVAYADLIRPASEVAEIAVGEAVGLATGWLAGTGPS